MGLLIGQDLPLDSIAGTLARDGVATPHQLSLVVTDLGGLTQSATASVRIRTGNPEGSWSSVRPLYRVQTADVEQAPPWGSVADVFAWTIFGLQPGTLYDVELTLDDGVTTDVRTPVEFTTKSLPAEPGAVDVTITNGSTPSQINTALSGASPGDHIQFEDGTYSMSGVTFPSSLSGSSESAPTYITGESRNGVILTNTSQVGIIRLTNDLDNVVFQDLTGLGSETDEIPGLETSTWLYCADTAATTNITVRRTTVTGVNRGIYVRTVTTGASDQHTGWLVYNNTITGENLWSDGTPDYFNTNRAWDDYAVLISGNGHSVFSNTLTAFGDVFSCTSGSGGERSEEDRNQHYYWNDVNIALDDFVENDDGYRNITCYQNRGRNVVNCGSMDTTYGGPFINWGNLFLNVLEPRMYKHNSVNSGWFYYNNTYISVPKDYRSNAVDDDLAIWYQPSNGAQDHCAFVNNVVMHISGTPDDTIRLEDGGYGTCDFHNNFWYPDAGWQFDGEVDTTLANLQAGLPSATNVFSTNVARFENDEIASSAQVWTTTVALGTSAGVELTADYVHADVVITNAGLQNEGYPVPNITDSLTETYSGAAPDPGCAVPGLTLPVVGDTTNGVPGYASGMVAYDVRQMSGSYAPVSGYVTMADVTPQAWIDEASGGPGRTFYGVISAYSGGAGANVSQTADGRLVVHGGGHNDSGNNGFYIYDPRESGGAPTGWENGVDISDNSIVTSGTSESHSDGRPRSVHSYSGTCYAPDLNLYYRAGGSSFSGNGDFFNTLWEYDPTQAQGSRWTQLADVPGNSDDGMCLVYDQTTEKLICVDSGAGAWVYDISANTWSSEAGLTLFDNFDVNGDYDPSRNVVLVTMDNQNAQAITFNLSTDTVSAQSTITWTGSTTVVNETCAKIYDPTLDRWWFLGGAATGNYDTIAYCTGADLAAGGSVAVTEVALSANMAATGFNEAIIGTFNRYLFVDESRLIYTVHRTDEAPWIILLPSS